MARRVLFTTLLLLLAAGATAAYYVFVWLPAAPQRALVDLRESLQAQKHDRVEYFFKVNQLEPQSSIVVAEIKTVVVGQYASEKEWLGIDLGTTALSYEIPVRFFYAVDVTHPSSIDFELDGDKRKLVAVFPPLEMFSLEPDLGALRRNLDVGWARTKRGSGEEVRERFEKSVMSDLRKRSSSIDMRALASRMGREQLENFVRVFIAALSPEAAEALDTVEVRFRSPSGAPPYRKTD